MQKSDTSPKSFLKNPQLLKDYECGICLQISLKPARCQGSCKKIFCMKCVSDTRISKGNDRCPNRCSQPFLVTPINNFQVDFNCPYNSKLCDLPIRTLKQFKSHHEQCMYIPASESQKFKMKKEYKCANSHHLQFWKGNYKQMNQSMCFECRQTKLCRSVCRICEQYYCVSCRVPKCSQTSCPLGHAYDFQEIGNPCFICDICDISTAVSNGGVYDDKLCNFGICQACNQELPQKIDEAHPQQKLANLPEKCLCGEKIRINNGAYMHSQCFLCKKWKQCMKDCPKCQKRYCLKCKIFEINSDGTCEADHNFVLHEISSFAPSQMQKESDFGCMRCLESFPSYYYDFECKIRLCDRCFKYSIELTDQSYRPIQLKCRKGHCLHYIRGCLCSGTCVICNKEKIFSLGCKYCGKQFQPYCFQCRPIKLETCYFNHPLKQVYIPQGGANCQFCMKVCQNQDMFMCKKCAFFVCVKCRQGNLLSYGVKSNKNEMEEEKEMKIEKMIEE